MPLPPLPGMRHQLGGAVISDPDKTAFAIDAAWSVLEEVRLTRYRIIASTIETTLPLFSFTTWVFPAPSGVPRTIGPMHEAD